MSQASKNEEKKFRTKSESFAQSDEETRRGRRLKASYQSFEGRSLKNTCMKLGRRRRRRRKWIPVSPLRNLCKWWRMKVPSLIFFFEEMKR